MAQGNTRTLVAEVFPLMTPTGGRVTTNRTISDDLRRSLALRGILAGETWLDFKRAMEAAGVEDDHVLGSIDFGNAQESTRRIFVEAGPDGVEVREVR